jgi:predicted lipoprotein with Yx(FWY)xxD motif
MHARRKSILALAGAALLAVALAACGGSDDNSNSNAAADMGSGSGAGGQTVATKSVSGVGEVLVDSSGKALYTNDMDTGSKIACTGQCLTEWVPLAAPSGGKPTSDDSAVQAKLGTVKRPDGSSQVTFGGLPLYSFVEDTAGQVTGNGFADSFDGTDFVWTAATASGAASSSSTTTSGSSGGGGGVYGGGGY